MTEEMGAGTDLGKIRYMAATYLKFMIQAMMREKKGFFSEQDLRDWQIEGLASCQRMSTSSLLEAAFHAHAELYRLVWEGGNEDGDELTSAGLLPGINDDQYRIIENVLSFVNNPSDLRLAADAAKRGEKITWAKLANWQNLGQIRKGLNELSLPGEQKVENESNIRAPAAKKSVVLGKTWNDPIEVLGQRVSPISPMQFRCVRILLEAHPARFTAEQIECQAALGGDEIGDAGSALRRLSKRSELWAQVVLMPQEKGNGYGLL